MRFTVFGRIALAGCLSATVATAVTIDAQIVEKVSPSSRTCQSDKNECRTSTQVAPLIDAANKQYGLTCKNEQAAVLALMALESDDFQYKHNVSPPPGAPGQGTVNMQGVKFNLLYAKSIPAVAGMVANISSIEGLSDDEKRRILALLTPDEYNFGSAAWFLTSQCSVQVRNALRRDVNDGFKQYMECVGAPFDFNKKESPRMKYFTRAKAALGIS